MALCEDFCDTLSVRIHSEVFENCNFHVYCNFSNSCRRPSWIAQSYKFERTPFADHSDGMRPHSVQRFMRYWQFDEIGS